MFTPGRPFTLLLVALVALACSTAGPGSSPTSPPTMAPGSTPTGASSTPLPTPQPGELAGLVVRLTWCDDVCVESPGTSVYADGRVVWAAMGVTTGPNQGSGLVERTLTPAGLQMVRDALDATGLFGADGVYGATVHPGKEPPAHGAKGYRFRAPLGVEDVVVMSTDPDIFEFDNRAFPGTWDIAPEAYTLAALAGKLEDPEAWLSGDAWADDVHRNHAADRFLLVVTADRWQGDLGDGPDVDDVRWPFPSSIDTVGNAYAIEGQAAAGRCMPITRGLAASIANAERAIGVERDLNAPFSSNSYAWHRGPGDVSVTIRVLLPDQPMSCAGGGQW